MIILDLSSHQNPDAINYPVLFGQLDGVILRCAYGDWKDPAFERHYAEATARGIPVGAYQFVTQFDTVTNQLRVLSECVAGKNLRMGIWGDIEIEYNKPLITREQVINYISGADSVHGQIGIYTGAWSWNPVMQSPIFADHKLWVATYGASPILPIGWTSWWLWQYTSSLYLEGYGDRLDSNYFWGRRADWDAWINGTEAPPEELVKQFEVVIVTPALNVRSGPSTGYPAIDVVFKDSVHDVYDVADNGWLKIGTGRWISGNPLYVQRINDLTIEQKVEILWEAHPELHG